MKRIKFPESGVLRLKGALICANSHERAEEFFEFSLQLCARTLLPNLRD